MSKILNKDYFKGYHPVTGFKIAAFYVENGNARRVSVAQRKVQYKEPIE